MLNSEFQKKILLYEPKNECIVAIILGVRILGWIIYILFCFIVVPFLKRSITLHISGAKSLFSFGGWMIIINVLNLLIAYMERFIIGAMISIAAVAYYATPYELVTILLFIPGSIIKVLFPSFVDSFAQDRYCLIPFFVKGFKYIF